MWHLYILQCSDKSLYTGIALDVKRRLREHSLGQGSRYVRSRLPAKLVYREALKNKSKALRREAEIKRLTRRQKLVLIIGSP